jgi:NADPH-dependent 2,4-dienoyl-CoA reductase/sulfur reductase-like enzyme
MRMNRLSGMTKGLNITAKSFCWPPEAHPRRLSFGGEDILYYRTLEGYWRLARMSKESQKIAVIGGGFIGAEVAAALAMNGKKVTMLFPDDGIGVRIYPHDLSRFLNETFRNKGVEVLPGESVTGLSTSGNRHVLQTQSGREVAADGVIAGIGIEPNVDLAKAAGLQVGNGIRSESHQFLKF